MQRIVRKLGFLHGNSGSVNHICVKRRKSCLSCTASSVHFNWKHQQFLRIGTFLSFEEGMYLKKASFEVEVCISNEPG